MIKTINRLYLNSMENKDTGYVIINKATGEEVKEVSFTSDPEVGGEEGNFLSFTTAEGTEIRFDRVAGEFKDSYENDEYTATFKKDEPTIPVVETPTETA